MENLPDTIPLPFSTNAKSKRPTLKLTGRDLRVTYGGALPEHARVHVAVMFKEVLALEYCDGTCVSADHVVDSDSITVRATSDWLAEVLRVWDNRYGRTEFQLSKGGNKRFKHYQMYFEDFCGIQLIGSSCEVRTEEEPLV
ncbi:MAG: hypothetical protein WC655_09345 [Candidatus Hydrogenedentales bacterium]|jgi:hypothetical protein